MSVLPPAADSRTQSHHFLKVPLPDSCTAASGALFDQLVGAAKQRQRGQFKLAHRSPRFEFALVNLSQTVKCCLSDSDRGPLPSTKRVTDVTQ
jgi:hypothetical protein